MLQSLKWPRVARTTAPREANATMTAAALLGVAVIASVVAVHPHPHAGFGAHAAMKSALAGSACLLALVVARPNVTLAWPVALVGAVHAFVVLTAASAASATPREIALASASVLLLVVGHAIAREPGRLELAVRAAVIAASIAALVAIFEIQIAELPWAHVRRPQSTLGNRNFLAQLLAAVVPLVWVHLQKRSWARPATLAVFFYVIAVTRCRAAWLALVVIAVVVLARDGRRAVALLRENVVPLASSALGAALSFAPDRLAFKLGAGAAVGRMFDYGTGSGAGRIAQARFAADLAFEHPLGSGLGGFPRELSRRAELASLVALDSGRTPSSDLVRVLAEAGVLGLAAIVVVLAVAAAAFLSKRARADATPRAALASATAIAVMAVVDAPLFRPETSLLFGVCLAALPCEVRAFVVKRAWLAALLVVVIYVCARECIPK